MEDAAALIQAHSIRGSARALPAIGADGVIVSRLSGSVEAGSTFVLNYSNFANFSHECEQFDSFGPKQCTIYYDQPFLTTFAATLNGGVKSGDAFYQSFNFGLSVNESNFWSFLVPKDMLLESRCSICQDSCSWSAAAEKFTLGLTVPTVWEDAAVCNGTSTQEEFVLINTTTVWPKPLEALGLGGTITLTTGVYDKDNNTRVSGSYTYTLTAPSMLAAEPEHSALQQLQSDPRSFPGVLLDWITGAMQVTRKAKGSSKTPVDSASKSLMFDFVVKTINSGSSVSLTASTGCTSTDSLGSVSCEFGLGETITLSTTLDISFTAVKGATLYRSRKFHMGGNMSIIVDMLLPKVEVVKPLCGTAEVTLPGSSQTYQPPKCGFYRFEFSTQPADVKMFDDFVSFNFPSSDALPFLPQTFDDLLPISYTQEVQLRNPDNSTIMAFEVTYGLKTAGA